MPRSGLIQRYKRHLSMHPGDWNILGLFDDNPEKHGRQIQGGQRPWLAGEPSRSSPAHWCKARHCRHARDLAPIAPACEYIRRSGYGESDIRIEFTGIPSAEDKYQESTANDERVAK